jgi:uncharacterized protein YggE
LFRFNSSCLSDKEFNLDGRRNFAVTAFGHVRDKIRVLPLAALVCASVFVAAAQAQTPEPTSPPTPPPTSPPTSPPTARSQARVVVIGEGSITVAPDYARIRSGVTTTAKTVKEASDSNSKVMVAIIAALADAGIAKKDIQTSEFSIEPVYTSSSLKISTDGSNAAPKLSGFRVSNHVNVIIRQMSRIADILDGVVKAGATDVGNVAFLVSDREQALDQAREAATANARHKAELYAQASGVTLGRVAWITESSDFQPIVPMGAARAKMAAAPVPIETGEDTMTARVTVGFDISQ